MSTHDSFPEAAAAAQQQHAMNRLNENMGAIWIKLTYLNKCLKLFARERTL